MSDLNPVLTSEYRKKLCDLSHEAIFESEGRAGFDYLMGRGVSEESIKTFRLGYCPISSGVPGFAGMLIVPYYDEYGDLIAVTARDVDKHSGPKWWHESFNKPDHLFGMNHSYRYIHESNSCVVLEGQMDVIALFQREIKNVVAVCGSTFSMQQFWKISRLCENIYLLFDADTNYSGQKSIKRVYEEINFMKTNKGHEFSASKIYIPKLPMDYDADEYVREFGADSLKKIIDSSSDSKELEYAEIEEMINGD